MNENLNRRVKLAIGVALLSGCAGTDRILFMTKTNVGLDVDSTPPTAEITIARRELAIIPTFPHTIGDVTTLSLLASFGLGDGVFDPNITSVFAGNSAALALASPPIETSELDADVRKKYEVDPICLAKEPDTRHLLTRMWHFITRTDYTNQFVRDEIESRTRAFYFATDTAFGLKVAWNGTGGPYPTSLKLGYNRAEFAYPPIFVSEKPSCNGFSHEDGKPVWEVRSPSFIATLDNSSRVKNPFSSDSSGDSDTGVEHVQFFATGAAATAWASRPSVKKETFKMMAPKTAKSLEATE